MGFSVCFQGQQPKDDQWFSQLRNAKPRDIVGGVKGIGNLRDATFDPSTLPKGNEAMGKERVKVSHPTQ